MTLIWHVICREVKVEEVYVSAAVLVNEEIGKAGDVDTALINLKMKNGAICVIDNSRKACYGYDQEQKCLVL